MARPRRSQQARERLLDHGVEVLADQGYHGTGLKELLEALQIPKGSFYNYFKSKEDFGAEVVRHYAKAVDDRLDAILSRDGDALTNLKDFFSAIAEHHQEKQLGCLVGNLGAELGGGYELIRQAMAEGLQAWRDRFEEALAQAQRQGSVRKDLSARVLADFLLNGFEGALLRMRIEQTTQPIRKFSSLVLNQFFARKYSVNPSGHHRARPGGALIDS